MDKKILEKIIEELTELTEEEKMTNILKKIRKENNKIKQFELIYEFKLLLKGDKERRMFIDLCKPQEREKLFKIMFKKRKKYFGTDFELNEDFKEYLKERKNGTKNN